MTEDNNTETSESTEGTEPEGSGQEESPVLTEVRKQLREEQKARKKAEERIPEVEANARAAVQRENAIKQQLVAANIPDGITPLVEEKLGDAEVTAEAVTEALTAIGFEITASDDSGTQETQQTADNLSEVANLGNQVAQAANQQTPDNLTDKINAAETPEELAQIMAEAGQS